MAEVIDLRGRKKQKEDLDKTQRLQALRTVLLCSQCALRCARCGAQSESTTSVTRAGVSFRLCPSCLEEYRDLLAYLEGESGSDRPFWYNREWVRWWLAWLEYQHALAKYLNSAEVLLLLQDSPEE